METETTVEELMRAAREQAFKEAIEIAESHRTLDARNRLIEKFPAGDYAMGMAGMIARAIREHSEKPVEPRQ